MRNIQIEKNIFSCERAAKEVAENGVAVVEGFYDTNTLDLLHREFEQAFLPNQKGISAIPLGVGRGLIFNKYQVDNLAYAKTFEVFSAQFMDDLASRYWGRSVKLNEQIYFMNEVVGTTHVAMDMHFDILPTFKFFIYLTDTTRENGAFACVPGSQQISADIRKKLGKSLSPEQREVTRRIPFGEDEVVHIEGKAGTLIIFTTEVFHRAGKVSKGERRVMRGHNRP